MPEYIVNSAILRKEPKACAEGAAKMLTSGKIKGVEVKSCYCCGAEGRVAFIVESPDRDTVLETMEKLDIPVASIMEAEEVKHKK
jgi:nitrate reductase NapAB chaperone NapD